MWRLIQLNNRYLAHHGVKGQKWGERRWQNYDGSLTPAGRVHYGYGSGRSSSVVNRKAGSLSNKYTNSDSSMNDKGKKAYLKYLEKSSKKGSRPEILRQQHTVPKGTVIYRTVANENENLSGPKYVTYLDADRQHYRRGWIKRSHHSDVEYEKTYTLTEDLKIPGRDELKEVIASKVTKDSKLLRETCDTWFKMAEPMYFGIGAEISESERKTLVDEIYKNMKNAPVDELYYTAAQTLGMNSKLKTSVIDELSKRGYNAMTDEASVGGQNGWAREGIDPLIVFDASKVMNETSTKRISNKEEQKAYAKDVNYNRKFRVNEPKYAKWSAIEYNEVGDVGMYYRYLAHHGIIGQKRGVRRYQNYDGSLTPLGRARYGIGVARKRWAASKANKVKKQKAKENEKIRKMKAQLKSNQKKIEYEKLKAEQNAQRNELRRQQQYNKTTEQRLKAQERQQKLNLKKQKAEQKLQEHQQKLDIQRVKSEQRAQRVELKRQKQYARSQALQAKKQKKENKRREQEFKEQQKQDKLNKRLNPSEQALNNRAKTISQMSNAELQSEINRLNLERQYKYLTTEPKKQSMTEKAVKYVANVGGKMALKSIEQIGSQYLEKQINTRLANSSNKDLQGIKIKLNNNRNNKKKRR